MIRYEHKNYFRRIEESQGLSLPRYRHAYQHQGTHRPRHYRRGNQGDDTQVQPRQYDNLWCPEGALADGLLEPREMPHAETLYIMKLMDGLRAKWDVRYPMD